MIMFAWISFVLTGRWRQPGLISKNETISKNEF